MIFQAIFTVVLSIFSSIVNVAVPLLPEGFQSVLTTVLQYIDTGLQYIWIFIPRNLALQLFQWWITLGAILITIELALEVWRVITGNVGGKEASIDDSSSEKTK